MKLLPLWGGQVERPPIIVTQMQGADPPAPRPPTIVATDPDRPDRARIVVIKNKDGIWLRFIAPSGREAMIQLSRVINGSSPVTRDTIEETCLALLKPRKSTPEDDPGSSPIK